MTTISSARRRAWQQRGGRNSRRKLLPNVRTHLARKAAAARWKRTPKAVRTEAARKAVLARWARAKQQHSTAVRSGARKRGEEGEAAHGA